MSRTLGIVEVYGFGPAALLRLQGALDARSTPLLLDRCREVRQSRRDLVLNLSGITYLASSGVGGLLVLFEDFRRAGLSLRYAALSPAASSVMEPLNLGSFLEIYDAERDALDVRKAA